MNNYLDRLRTAFPHKSDLELDLLCSSDRTYREFTGLSSHQHRMAAMKGLWPQRVWHEWRDQRVRSVQECIEKRIQELMWIGSSNSNKSADMADIALTLWWTNPENTSIYVTSPYESATELGVWAYIIEQFNAARDLLPTLPGKIRLADNSIVLHDKNPRSFIRVTTVDQIGKLVGKKARNFDDGLMVIIADELPAFSGTAARNFLAVMPNLLSVPNLLVIGAGNFAHVGDALGIFCDPDEKEVEGGYDGFDPDRHFRWRTKRGGLTLRFDGLRSPNVMAGADLYPFVTTIEYIGKLAAQPGGLLSPDAMRYVRSAPITSLDEYTVMNGERLRAGGAYDDFQWTGDDLVKFAFFDPGFGGDPCALQKFKLGYVATADGKRHTLALWDAPFIIPIKVGLKDESGTVIPAEDQVVTGAKKHCEQFGIIPSRVGYDGSMRANLAQRVGVLWSPQVVALDSNGQPTARAVSVSEKKDAPNGQKVAVTWRDKVDRLLSEFWFAAASVVDSMQLRGLKLSPKAASQLCQRRWNWSGKKKRVETKVEYKETLRMQGKPVESPNEADALVGGVEMARRLGLNLEGLSPKGGALDLVLQMIRERSVTSSMARVHNGGERESLPSGKLHAMKRGSSNRLTRSTR